MAGETIRFILGGWLAATLVVAAWGGDVRGADPVATPDRQHTGGGLLGRSSLRQRQQVVRSLPLGRLTPAARDRIVQIAESPTLYRRLPAQAIDCERDMFLFLTRHPEVLVGLWQRMGITKVHTGRLGPYRLQAEDGNGTRCEIDLVYGDPNLHIYVAEGSYDGRLVTSPIEGKGVFVLRSSYAASTSGRTTVTGVLDCFIQLDNLGADLIARTFSGVIGRAADHNYVETARFMSQISQASQRRAPAMIRLAEDLPQCGPATRTQFVDMISTAARRGDRQLKTASRKSRPETSRDDNPGR